MVYPAWQAFKQGRDPEPGGYLDQPHWYTVLVAEFDAALESERAEQAKVKKA